MKKRKADVLEENSSQSELDDEERQTTPFDALYEKSNNDINIKDDDGFSLLHLAVLEGRTKFIIEALKNPTLDPNVLSDREYSNYGFVTPLHLAVITDDEDCVKALLKSREPDINATTMPYDEDGQQLSTDWLHATSLHIAILEGNLFMAKLLMNSRDTNIHKGINEVWQEVSYGHGCYFWEDVSPLSLATLLGEVEIVECLLKCRDIDFDTMASRVENKNYMDEIEATSICETCTIHEETCESCESKNFDEHEGFVMRVFPSRDHCVDIYREKGFSVVHCAVIARNEKLIELFSRSGVNVDAVNNDGYPPLYYSAENNNFSMVKTLIENGVDPHTVHPNILLKPVVTTGNYEMLNFFVKVEKLSINKADHNGELPIHSAKNDKMFLHLLTLGTNDKHHNLLHHAAEKGFIQGMEYLIQQGLNVNKKEKSTRRQTPLYLAVQAGHVQAVEKLLHYGAHVDVKDDEEKTIFHYIAEYGQEDILEVIYKNAGIINTPDAKGRWPLHYAVTRSRYDIYHDDRGYVHDCSLSQTGSRRLPLVKIFSGCKEALNAEDNNGQTPLLTALNGSLVVLINELLKSGANVNHVNSKGYSALHVLCERHISKEELKILELLVRHGADVNNQTLDNQYTPLHLLTHSYDKRNQKSDIRNFFSKSQGTYVTYPIKCIKELLRTNQADLMLQDKEGNTVIHHAAEYGYKSLIKLYLKNKRIDLSLRNNFNETAFQLAEKNKHDDVCKRLQKQYTPPSRVIHDTWWLMDFDDVIFTSKTPYKTLKIPGELIHDFLRALENRERNPQNTPNFNYKEDSRNFVSAYISFVVSNLEHKKGGEHGRKIVSFMLKHKDLERYSGNDARKEVGEDHFHQAIIKREQAAGENTSSVERLIKGSRCAQGTPECSAYRLGLFHSEQALCSFLEDENTIKNLLNKLKVANVAAGFKLYAVILDLHSTRYLCVHCEPAIHGLQHSTYEGGFLHNLANIASSQFSYKTPTKRPIRMLTRVSAENEGKRECAKEEDYMKSSIDIKDIANKVVVQRDDRYKLAGHGTFFCSRSEGRAAQPRSRNFNRGRNNVYS